MTTELELDIIKTEHNFFNVGDPLPVIPTHDHDAHIEKHQVMLDELMKQEESGFRNQKILILSEHIELHKEYKKRQSNR
jgi:hypothetical protein